MQKPDGLTILDPDKMPGPLFDLSLTDLPGISTRMEARLREVRVKSVEAFYNLAPKQARQIWGSVTGERFWYLLHGYDLPDQQTSRSSIGHSRILDPELRSPDAAKQVARRLTIKAAARLRYQQFYATRFAFGVRDEGRRWEAEASVAPAQDNFTFLRALDSLWSDMTAALQPRKVKKVSVVLSGLRKEGDITRDLFDAVSPTAQRAAQRSDTLSETMDFLNGKYGAETLRLGVSPRTSAGYVGTKIAFARVPDLSEFEQ
jgi:DNA polymerase IV